MPTILHTEASLGLGGQELRIVAESRWLRDHGWGALIACQPESRLFAEARTAGVDAVALPMRNAVDLGALLALRRLMKALAVDLVHTHSSTDSWSGALAAKSLRLAVVRSRHVSIAIRSALVYRLADRIVTSGEAVRAIVVRAGIAPERVVAIPPGVDTARFHPVVATTVGGSPELVRDGETGRLVPPEDPPALARAVLEILRDPERARAMGRAGQAAISAGLTLDASMARTTAVYRELLAARGRPPHY